MIVLDIKKKMYLNFITQTNKNYIIELNKDETIQDVRDIFYNSYGIKKEIRFFYDGQEVDDLTKFDINTPITIIFIDNELQDKEDIHQKISEKLQEENEKTNEVIDPPSFHENVIKITEMGFKEEDVIKALRKCKYDPNEALDLLTAIIEEEEEEFQDIVLTEQDEEAIMRLQDNTFDKSFVTDIYIQCNQNEDKARELLLG